MSWIEAGVSRVESLPAGELTPPERDELRRLLGAREEAAQRLAVIEQQLTLFITVSRDKRGIAGRVRVDPETGTIAACAAQGGQNGD